MVSDSDDADAAASRLEAALERIATAAAARSVAADAEGEAPRSFAQDDEVRARLDQLIARVRAVVKPQPV